MSSNGKNIVAKAVKIAVACALAIVLSYAIGLKFYVTAGIITILSIQNTKKETLATAARRAIAYVCALFISFICFSLFGYSIGSFCVYILLFVLFCLAFRYPEAMAMDSVLISHFLGEQSMNIPLIANETLLFLIGTGCGIAANLLLRRQSDTFLRLSGDVDEEIRGVLTRMAERIRSGEREGYDGACFQVLNEKITKARGVAVANMNNSLFFEDTYELDYIEMRQKQAKVLENVYKSIIMLEALPKQSMLVADFVQRIAEDYSRENTVEGLLSELNELFLFMKKTEIPADRKEFEARAVLFYILKQLQEFLELKMVFVKSRAVAGQ